jgi:4'-phosphopantetheinyl transferase
VHVWRARLNCPASVLDRLRECLSDEERHRADRFRFDEHRQRFIARRGARREILASYTGADPSSIEFDSSRCGKPSLAGAHAGNGLRFNASSSGSLSVLAITLLRDVGIDVEAEREVPDARDIARRFFSQSEQARLETVPAADWHRAFLACWTRKEAYVKAVGLGVSMPLSDFDVVVEPGDRAMLLGTRPDPDEARRWSMRSFEPGPGYVGALVVEGGIEGVRILDWPRLAKAEASRK